MEPKVEWFGLDGEWHVADVVAPVDDHRVLIDLGGGALIVAATERVRDSVRVSS